MSNAAKKAEVPFDWQLVKIEQKRMCNPDWVAKMKIATCGFYYLYDANTHVHICSFTPVYELYSLVPYATFTEDVSEDVQCEVDEELSRAEEVCDYYDIPFVKHCESRSAEWNAPERESDETREEYYNRATEEMNEYFKGNHPCF